MYQALGPVRLRRIPPEVKCRYALAMALFRKIHPAGDDAASRRLRRQRGMQWIDPEKKEGQNERFSAGPAWKTLAPGKTFLPAPFTATQ
jgi:hypothetical protein